jgi:hypothetical protein
MTTAKEHADEARQRTSDALVFELCALAAPNARAFVTDAQASQRNWICALTSLLRFLDALPEPVAIPPVPQPSEEARRRGLLVGAVVRHEDGDVGRVIGHTLTSGEPCVQSSDGYVGWPKVEHLTVIRPAPPAREPNAEALRRGLYIGARVTVEDAGLGTVVTWDADGDPFVEFDGATATADACAASWVTLAGGAS